MKCGVKSARPLGHKVALPLCSLRSEPPQPRSLSGKDTLVTRMLTIQQEPPGTPASLPLHSTRCRRTFAKRHSECVEKPRELDLPLLACLIFGLSMVLQPPGQPSWADHTAIHFFLPLVQSPFTPCSLRGPQGFLSWLRTDALPWTT
jgi:hypothetical protein